MRSTNVTDTTDAAARADYISNGPGHTEQNLTSRRSDFGNRMKEWIVKNNMIKTLLITCGLLATTAGLSLAEIEVGKPVPSFTLPDTNGKTRSLADFKGKFVVLEWYQPD